VPVDYAKRSAPKKKKKNTKGGSKKRSSRGAVRQRKQTSPITLGRVLLVLAIFIAFIFGLWFLKDRSPEAVSSPVAPEAALDALPEIPEERWRYPEELENKQVEVDVPERAESQPRLMQCGSFRSFADAESLRARIAMQGMESQVRESHGSNGRWFRVILGPFDNLREAQRANNQLQRAGVHGCQIWLWNLD